MSQTFGIYSKRSKRFCWTVYAESAERTKGWLKKKVGDNISRFKIYQIKARPLNQTDPFNKLMKNGVIVTHPIIEEDQLRSYHSLIHI